MIRFGREVCGDLGAAAGREWLETNGLGGFASSTIAGMNTRRYHGLLTAALKPPVERYLLLAKLEETLVVGDRKFDLSVNRYPGAVYPQGYRFLREFRLDPYPVFVYEVEGIEITKRVFMVHGENTTVIEYEARGGECGLEIRPLIAFRDYHATTHQNGAIDRHVEIAAGRATVAPYRGLPALHFAHDADEIAATGDWYYQLEYDVERARGLDFQEDLFNPFVARFHSGQAAMIVSTEVHAAREAPALRREETARRAAVRSRAPLRDPLVEDLTAAADQFLVKRGDLKTIIAGYPWFGDWGRDTMIALPGLTLVTGEVEAAKSILLAFAHSVDRGMLPNRFPDGGEAPEYNTADATLWFFEAARALVKYTRETAFVREHLYPALCDILDWHVRGTRYGIRADADGLLRCGEPGVQLTWMDAKIGDWVVTPRGGKPVEIQALWYNALRILQEFARVFCDAERERAARKMADLARRSFGALFWNPEAGCLYDVVDGDAHDARGGAGAARGRGGRARAGDSVRAAESRAGRSAIQRPL
jgi:predicted glycogen debranching enzyme